MKTHITFRDVLLWLLLSVFTGIVIYTAVQLWYPVTPIRVDKINVSKPVVSRGEAIYFRFVGEKFLQLPVQVTLELVNGERVALISYQSNNPVGTIFKKRNFVIPYHIIPGRYQLKWTGIYEVNALRTVVYSAKSDWITIK